MVLRKQVVVTRLQKLKEVLANLRQLQQVPLDEFKFSFRNYWLAERGLQLAADILFDIGNHILSGFFGVSPSGYEEIPKLLAEKGVITYELRDRLKGLGGFRNIIVHAYLELDLDEVYEELQKGLEDFDLFLQQVSSWIDTVPES